VIHLDLEHVIDVGVLGDRGGRWGMREDVWFAGVFMSGLGVEVVGGPPLTELQWWLVKERERTS
jgi:hypothetical protein